MPVLAAIRSGTVRAMAQRLSWGLADQAVSSLTNFAVSVAVARTLGAVEFGIFTLAWVTYGVVLNVSRGLATDPLVVRFSGVPDADWRQAVSRSCATALGVGATTGVLSIAAGTAIGGTLGAAFVALGLILPALLLQDSWRFAFFAAGQGRRAFGNDMVWAGALVPGLLLAASAGSVFAFLLAWGGAAAVAAVFGWAQTGLLPHSRGVASWLRQQRDLGPRYLVENVSISGAAQIRMYGLGAIAGFADVGAVRGADLLLGPFIAVTMGLALVAVAEASRVVRTHPERLRTFCLGLSGVQTAGVLVWGLGVLALLPDVAGNAVLGEVWSSASALLVPASLAIAGVGLSNGATAGLRALGASRRSLRCQLFAATGLITGGLVGAAVAGASGSAWGAAIAAWLAAAVWWVQLLAGLRDHRRTTSVHGGTAATAAAIEGGKNTMTTAPRLTIGLPVYNGENYLAESLDALLGQTFSDFELIISDNASTDGTEAICRRYAAMDKRIRYIRQPRNIGARPNHNLLVEQARGELFKWAAHDDLYGRELLAACVTALDEHPEAVLAHADQAIINEQNQILKRCEYTLNSDSSCPPDRLRSLLFASGGDDEYGVIRTGVLRTIRPNGSYHNSSRPFMAELALRGPFCHVPELLYFRRDHPDRGDRNPTIRALCANLDPRRARHSTARLLTEYVLGFVGSISRAPLSISDRWQSYRFLVHWLARSGIRRMASRSLSPIMGLEDYTESRENTAVVATVVEGRERTA